MYVCICVGGYVGRDNVLVFQRNRNNCTMTIATK
jgi:hypothetical protein